MLKNNPLGWQDLRRDTFIAVYYGDPADLSALPQVRVMAVVHSADEATGTIQFASDLSIVVERSKDGSPADLSVARKPSLWTFHTQEDVRFADGHAYDEWLRTNTTPREE